ncbi:MAG: serine hydrolase domain-containing protein, partial [Leptospirales bacterium]
MIARRVTRATRGSLHGRLWPLLFVLSVGCLSGPPSRPTNLAAGDLSYLKEYMTWYMRKSMDAGELTGLSFALVDADGPLWTGGLGFADREAGLPADERSIYMVASISKMITAAAVMQLRERGKLNLDAPLARAIPEFRIRSRFAASAEPAASGVTLRNILSHHSGLPSDYLYGFYYRRTQAPADLREGFLMLPDLLGDEYLSASPGRLFAYSNLGYSLAGLAVAHIAAASENENASFGAFENYIQTNLFAPLRMPDSSFAPPKTPTFSAPGGRVYAQAYAAGARVPAPALRDLPAGGLFSSAADLGNFTRMLLNQGRGPGENARILAPDSVREMLSIQNAGATLDGEFQIGAGLFLRPREFTGVVTAGHGGDLPPFHASVMFSPDLGLGAVVLTNSSSSSADMNQIAGEFLRAAVEARSGSKASPRRALPPALSAARRAACDDCARYASYAGEYEAGFGILRVLYEADEPANLFLEIQGSRLEMIPRVGGDFSVQYRLLGL